MALVRTRPVFWVMRDLGAGRENSALELVDALA
jgi:hypothetical protein